MPLNANALDNIYSLYGFRKRNTSRQDVRVYTFRTGYFNNADVVPLSPEADPQPDFDQFQKSGFACSIRNYASLSAAERELFEGFFSLGPTRERVSGELTRFHDKQTNLIGAPYKYIQPPFRAISESAGCGNECGLTHPITHNFRCTG
jgi:hypothetical protein